MADFRIYDLTHEATPEDGDYIEIDNPTWPESRYTTRGELLADEVNARDAADTAIEDGAGLETDGSMTALATSTYLKNADFVAAGLNVNLKNGLALLDAAINTITGNLELEVQFRIESAELLALATPVTKIIAPGAGNFYWVMECCAKNNFGSVAYSTAGANGIYLQFTGASDYIVHLDKTFCELAATGRVNFEIVRHILPINIGIDVHAPDGNLTNGDGTIDVILRYVVHNDFGGTPAASGNCCDYQLDGTFVNADLTASGNLEIHHHLVTNKILIVILDNNHVPVGVTWTPGNEAGADTLNYSTVPIGGPIVGTWHYLVFAIA